MNLPSIKDYKRIVDNKLRGAYGETDTQKRTIRINKARHHKKVPRVSKNRDGSEKLVGTIFHEETHAKYPHLSERQVVKREKRFLKTGTKLQKSKLYKLYV